MDRRQLLTGSALLAIGAQVTGAAAQAPTGENKTFVLVPGASFGGWVWRKVEPKLVSAGHRVFSVTNTGLGERVHLMSREVNLETFINDVIGILKYNDINDAILVGHSFAGVTITAVADRVPERIKHLVYLDAVILENGKSFFDQFPPESKARAQKAAQDFSGGVTTPTNPPDVVRKNLGLSNDEDARFIASRTTPNPIAALESQLIIKNEFGNGLPKTYIACTNPAFPSIEPSKKRVKEQQGWNWKEIASGHAPMVTHPDELASMLLAI
jgi:pimeloyl-ACP methyl ester carboxylesterase